MAAPGGAPAQGGGPVSGLLLGSTVLLAVLLGVAVLNLLSAPRLERTRSLSAWPMVSVLVPARNEAHSLAGTLPALLRSAYPALEVLVLDDASEDDTARIAEDCAAASHRLRLLRGEPLPEGWLGKAWACHQLAGAARGEILVFCDADVTVQPLAVRHTVAAMLRSGAGALTALPRQRFAGCLDAAVVPLVTQLPVLALLPLALVGRVRSPAVAMANGQWLAMTREAYRACGGHAACRDQVVEDLWLARSVKRAGHRLQVVLSGGLLEVRMYRDAPGLREGFRKNLWALTGGGTPALALAAALFALACVLPWSAAVVGVPGAAVPLALLVLLRVVAAATMGQGAFPLLLHPLGSVALLGLAAASWRGARGGGLRWKGRIIRPRGAAGSAP